MYLIRFAFRRLLRHWRTNLLIFSGMVLTGALVAGLPAYAQVIAADSLEYLLRFEPPFSRNIVLTAGPEVQTFNAALNQVLEDSLGFLITDRVEVREMEFSAYRSPDGNPDPQASSSPVRLWSFSSLNQDTIVLDGRTPNHTSPLTGPAALIDPQPVEAAIGRSTAEDGGLSVGDVLYDPGGGIRFEIVGIVEPVDPADERWFADPRPFELEIELGLNEDIVTIPLLLNPASMAAYFPGSERTWRVIVNRDVIRPASAEAIRTGIEKAQTGFATYGVELNSGIPLLLDTYRSRLQTTQIALLLLAAQALIFVFYTLGMITAFMLDRSRTELAALTSRGARRRQMLLLFSLEGFFVAVPAALIGPLLAALAVRWWVGRTGIRIDTGLPAEAWLLALAAALAGWVSFVLPGMAWIGRGMVQHQQARARPPQQTVWQARNLDIFLLVVSLLAYWQLSERGSFVMRRIGNSTLADPLLLVGPSLLLIAVALVFLRLFPLVLRAVRKGLASGRGLLLPVGLARLARDPSAASRVILLISLAVGLTIFSITFRDSLEGRQEEMAHYIAGADLRASTRRTPMEEVRNFEGVRTLSPVYRMRIQGPKGNFITLLIVDPETFRRVAWYPPGIGGGVAIESLMRILERELPRGTVPAIFSRSALPSAMGLENETSLQVVRDSLTVEIRGIIQEFPTLAGDFVILNVRDLPDITSYAAVNIAVEEAWLSLEPGAVQSVREHLPLRGEILGDSAAQLAAFRTDPLAEGGKRAFALNAAILAVLSIVGFFIVHYFTAQTRGLEFSILRAGGLTGRQLLAMLVVEGLIVMVLGLASGTLVGLGLSFLMRPFLSRVFTAALGGAVVEHLVIDWAAIGQVFGLLIVFYILALVVSVFILVRMGIHRVLRTSVE